MFLSCPGCGAGVSGNPLAAMWKCAHCGRANPNEEYIKAQVEKIDFNKSRTSVELGKLEYGSGRFHQAISHFELAIREHGDNVEAWTYYALAGAKSATLSDIGERCTLVSTCLKRAKVTEPSSELVELSDAICRNAIGLLACRGVTKFHEDARRAWTAFASINKAQARQAANTEAQHAILVARHGFDLAPEDPRIAVQLARNVLALLNDFEKRIGAFPEIRKRAECCLAAHRAIQVKAGVLAPIKPRQRSSTWILWLCLGALILAFLVFVVILGTA